MTDARWEYSKGIALISDVHALGKKVTSVVIHDLERGDLILAGTKSRNRYLFEVIDPKSYIARVFITAGRATVANGDRGNHLIDEILRVGEQIYYSNRTARTSAVENLTLLKAKSI